MRRMPVEQRRSELLRAAAHVIARDGLAAASVRAIVAEAGMPLGALHSVFSSRDELLRALIFEIARSERVAVLKALDTQESTDLETMLRTGLETYLELLEQDSERELAVAELSLHEARHDLELAREQWASYFCVAAEGLQRAAQLCNARWSEPVEEIAQSLISVLDGLTLTWLTTRDTAAARRHIAFAARSFAALALPVQSRR